MYNTLKQKIPKIPRALDPFFYSRKSILLKIIYAFLLRKHFFSKKNDSKNKALTFYYEKKKAIYLIVSKSACTSIETNLKETVMKDEGSKFNLKKFSKEYYDPHYYNKRKKIIQKSNFYKFTFVRNPFRRVVSCFTDKVKQGFYTYTENYFFLNYAPLAIDNKSFQYFLKKIKKIPDSIADHHFKSQYSILFYQGQPLYDYVGKIEDFPESFEYIRKKFNLEKLGHHNPSPKTIKKKWQDFYDEKTANLVYKRYQKDFTTWYPDAYQELMDYLQKKKN